MKPFLPIFFLLAFFTSAYIAHANTFYTPEGAIVNINIENKTKPGQPYEQGHKIKVSGFLSSYAPMRVTMDAITIGNDRVELLPSAGIEITTQIAGVPLLLTEKDFTVSLPQGTQLPYTANVDVRVGVVVAPSSPYVNIGVLSYQNIGITGTGSIGICFGMSGGGSSGCGGGTLTLGLGNVPGYNFVTSASIITTPFTPIQTNKRFLVRWVQDGAPYGKIVTVYADDSLNRSYSFIGMTILGPVAFLGGTNYNSEIAIGPSTGWLSGGATNVCAASEDPGITIGNVPVCSGGFIPPECSDGADNDADGFTDDQDSQCHSDLDASNNLSYTPDGTTEASPFLPSPECSDGIDNDRDGFPDIGDAECHSDGNASNDSSYDFSDDSEMF